MKQAPEDIHALVQFIARHKLNAKLQLTHKQTAWVAWLTIPVAGYLDYGAEPLPFSEVLGIRLSPTVRVPVGTLVPPVVKNYTQEISSFLELAKFSYQIDNGEFLVAL